MNCVYFVYLIQNIWTRYNFHLSWINNYCSSVFHWKDVHRYIFVRLIDHALYPIFKNHKNIQIYRLKIINLKIIKLCLLYNWLPWYKSFFFWSILWWGRQILTEVLSADTNGSRLLSKINTDTDPPSSDIHYPWSSFRVFSLDQIYLPSTYQGCLSIDGLDYTLLFIV